jgi:hypothetical protein
MSCVNMTYTCFVTIIVNMLRFSIRIAALSRAFSASWISTLPSTSFSGDMLGNAQET